MKHAVFRERAKATVRSVALAATCLSRATAGSAAVSFAVAAPALLGTAGIASDYAIYAAKKAKLQSAADSAALAAARELSVMSGGSASTGAKSQGGGTIEAIAESYVDSALPDPENAMTTTVSIDTSSGSVNVKLEDAWQPFFAHFLGADITPITVEARAELVGESKICVIALTPSGVGAISMTNSSSLKAQGCSIYSNSTNSQGFFLGSGSTVKADLVCSAGGVYNKGATSGTQVLTDCPAAADPLAGRTPPAVGPCDFKNTVVTGQTVTLTPGVYCGGIMVHKNANVTFAPGNYVIKDGLFLVSDTSKITGKNVAFYLTGVLSLIQFLGSATIDLSGAEEGEMAGMLFFEDPAAPLLRIHNIRATNAFNLTGTIYLPKGNLLIDPAANVAEQSAYTAIIVKRLVVDKGMSLVLNTNYNSTKVPVPDGIRASSDVVLAQ